MDAQDSFSNTAELQPFHFYRKTSDVGIAKGSST
jgi:hypothetical protein